MDEDVLEIRALLVRYPEHFGYSAYVYRSKRPCQIHSAKQRPSAYRLEARSRDVDAMVPGIVQALERERHVGVPFAHVEAGMRSGDMTMPEEHTRIEVDSIAELLLCPDDRSRGILEAEGVPGTITVVGDVMADACFTFAPIARERSDVLERLDLGPRTYVVATIHRDANVTEPRLDRIVSGLDAIEERVVFPAHPRTRDALLSQGLSLGHVRLVEPLSYLDFAALASQARVIVTDSGGLQKEAYWYGVPCVTARPSTEWVDTVEQGANTLVDDDPERLVAAIAAARPLPAGRPSLYGDGRAAPKIAEALCTLLGQ
jgi:UDP-GlcNAc3NAcA epimerase